MQHLDDGYLQSWLDRDRSGISPAEAAGVEAHLAGCDVCAARLAELLETSERARSLLAAAGPTAAAAPDFEEVVRRAGRRAPSGGRRRGWMVAGWAASLVFAGGVGWLSHELLGPRADVRVSTPAAESEGSAARADRPPVQEDHGVEAPGAPAPSRDSPDPDPPPRDNPPVTARVEVAEAAPRDSAAVALDRETRPLLVRGQVVGRTDGRPIGGAQVAISGAPVGTLTARDGTFELSVPAGSAVAPGPVVLTAEVIGFRSATREIDSGGADSVSVDFLLEMEAVALGEVVVSGAAPAPVAEARRARQETRRVDGGREMWIPASRVRAEAQAGFTLLTVPELPILEIEVGEVGGGTAVRVRQALESGATLTLVQWKLAGPSVEPTLPEGQPVATVNRGEVRLVGAAPVAGDSLRVLLGGAR